MGEKLSKNEKEQFIENRVKFLQKIHEEGIKLDGERYNILVTAGIIDKRKVPKLKKKVVRKKTFKREFTKKTAKDGVFDQHIDIVDKKSIESKLSTNPSETINIRKDDWNKIGINYSGKRWKNITKKDWLPHNGKVNRLDPDFVDFIDSTLKGYSYHNTYNRFEMYKQQAHDWLSDPDSISNYDTLIEKQNYVRKERIRIRVNKLYGLMKYIKLKDEDMPTGERELTKPYDIQALAAYLFDSGFSVIFGKLRQVGFSSIIGGIIVLNTITKRNHFCKMLACDGNKVEEILKDKVKYPITRLPKWLKPSISNFATGKIIFAKKKGKGDEGGLQSSILVDAPTIDAINGGSPGFIAFDEIGLTSLLTAIINEGRPALFWINPDTGDMELKRQVFMWGTAGKMNIGGSQMRTQFLAAIEAWENRDFNYGIIPIFIDCFSKPGITKQFYEDEKKNYYNQASKSTSGDEIKIQFHQTYPITIEDMFMESAKTIIPMGEINASISRINDSIKEERLTPKYGYFQPLYDQSHKYPEGFIVPFKIVNVTFIEVPNHDPRGIVTIFKPPVEGWKFRYYQGTDPISAESGHSMMSSSIWDSVDETDSAELNFRDENYENCYLQTLYMGIYYDQRIRNLVEYNIGSGFYDLIKSLGFQHTIVPNKAIAAHLQTADGKRTWGIGKHGNNSLFINYKTREMLQAYRHRLNSELLFIQLKTFVEKFATQSGKSSWKVLDPRLYFDDMIDAKTYSYVAAEAFANYTPIEKKEADKKKLGKKRLYRDANGVLSLQHDRRR